MGNNKNMKQAKNTLWLIILYLAIITILLTFAFYTANREFENNLNRLYEDIKKYE